MDEYELLVGEWEMSLRAQRKSPKTIKAYRDSALAFRESLVAGGASTDVREITRAQVEAHIVALLERWSETTAATRYRCLQQWFRFLVENEEIVPSPMRLSLIHI